MSGKKKAKDDADSGVEKLTKAAKKAGERVRDSAERATRNATSLSKTVIDHAEDNAKQAFAAMRAAADAGSVADVAKIQAQFVKEQSARSLVQVKQLGDMIAGFGRSAIEQLRGK